MSTTTTTTTSAPPTASRPLGVAILAVLIGIYGFVLFISGLLIAIGSSVGKAIAGGGTIGALGSVGVLAGIIVLVIGLIILGLALGLWHLRMWALVLTVLFLVITIILDGLRGAYLTFGFIVGIVLLIYLLAVSRHFS